MAFRTGAVMKIQSAASVAQPLFGSWVTAGIGAATNVATTITLGSQCSSGNDAAQLFTADEFALLVEHDGTLPELVWVQSILNNTLTLGPIQGGAVTTFAHASGAFATGAFIMPSKMVNNVFVSREDGSTGTWMYIGNAFNMSATLRRIVKLANVAANSQPLNYAASEAFGGNPFNIAELWALGTQNDLYNVAFAIV